MTLAIVHLLSIVSETQFCVCIVKTFMRILSYMRNAVAPSSSGGSLTPRIHRENTSHHLSPLIISYILIAYYQNGKILFTFGPISLCLISVYKRKSKNLLLSKYVHFYITCYFFPPSYHLATLQYCCRVEKSHQSLHTFLIATILFLNLI